MKTKTKISKKSRLIAFLLAWILWPVSAHRWYTGRWATAFLQMITFGGLFIWVMVDIVMIGAGEFKDGNGYKLKNWSND